MKSKTQKSQDLKKLKEKLPKSTITIFTTFSRVGEKGLSVAQMRELKKSLRDLKETTPRTEYFVTKKSLIEKALKSLKFKSSNDGLSAQAGVDVYGISGSMGLVFSEGDAYAVSKKLYEFAKKNPALQFFGAIFEDSFLGKDAFLEIAKMPSRETLIARLLGMMKYPLTGLAVVLNEIAKKQQPTTN